METDLQAYISALHYDVPIENPDESYDNIDRKIGQFDFKIDRDNSDHNILTSYNQTNNLLSLNPGELGETLNVLRGASMLDTNNEVRKLATHILDAMGG